MAEQQAVQEILNKLKQKGIIDDEIEAKVKDVLNASANVGKKVMELLNNKYSIVSELLNYYIRFVELVNSDGDIADDAGIKYLEDLAKFVETHKKQLAELAKGFEKVLSELKDVKVQDSKLNKFIKAIILFGIFTIGVATAKSMNPEEIDTQAFYNAIKQAAEKFGISDNKLKELLDETRSIVKLIKPTAILFKAQTIIVNIITGVGIMLIVLAFKAKVGIKETLLTILGIRYRIFLARVLQKYPDKKVVLEALIKGYVYLVRIHYVTGLILSVLFTIIRMKGITIAMKASELIPNRITS